jgi:hypothetical protein
MKIILPISGLEFELQACSLLECLEAVGVVPVGETADERLVSILTQVAERNQVELFVALTFKYLERTTEPRVFFGEYSDCPADMVAWVALSQLDQEFWRLS